MKFAPLFTSGLTTMALLLPLQVTAFAPNSRTMATSSPLSVQQQTSSFRLPVVQKKTTQLQALPTDLVTETASSNAVLMNYFWETLITNGVPAALSLIVIGFGAFFFRPRVDQTQALQDTVFGKKNPASMLYQDLYGDQDQSIKNNNKNKNPLQKLFSAGRMDDRSDTLPQNIGVPKEQYIRLTHLNKKYDSYQYSLKAATQSRAAAAADYRKTAFGRAWMAALADMEPAKWQGLQKTERAFLQQGQSLLAELQALQTQLTQLTLDKELKDMIDDSSDANTNKFEPSVYQLDPAAKNETANAASNTTNGASAEKSKPQSSSELLNSISKLQKELQELELDFVSKVVKAVGPDRAVSIRTALLGDMAVRGSGSLLRDLQERPLKRLLGETEEPPKVFVARFPGDTTASQVATLREEVTAIVGSAREGIDEVLVVLQSGGGTVTGYGLAAAQLLRFKDAGLKLTIAVEQVAASGGYMMCCVADHIVASPFAVLGSIGVISDIPNVYERLKQEGIEFQTVTAGKYKRTLTPTKKVTREDFAKSKEDVEEILVLFRDFVAENRPQLDMPKIATGETWFGSAALERKLCDEIKTVDDVIMEAVRAGKDVYEVEYVPPVETVFGRITPANADAASGLVASSDSGMIGQAVRWLVRTVATEIKAELGKDLNINTPIQERYMMKDDQADRIRSQD